MTDMMITFMVFTSLLLITVILMKRNWPEPEPANKVAPAPSSFTPPLDTTQYPAYLIVVGARGTRSLETCENREQFDERINWLLSHSEVVRIEFVQRVFTVSPKHPDKPSLKDIQDAISR